MHRMLVAVPLALLLIPAWGACQARGKKPWPPSPHVAPTDALPPAEQQRKLRLPPGFEIQLVASEPDVMNPMNIAFDARGRLWVTMSSEYPFPNFKARTRDTVKILSDFGADGRARKITTFAENLNIPIGVLPIEDGSKAIIFSIPNIWLFEDTNGDGKADRKTPLLQSIGYRDTHGLTGEFQLGFDGWVYACHGFSNTSTLRGKDGSVIRMHSGNVYRFKPDGTRVNYHTHGQVNPFGLAFDPWGNLFSCDCHSQPIYQLLRGAWYPSFSKPHDGLGFGPAMMTNHHGSTAIAGIAYYAAEQFPTEFHHNLFIGNVVTNRINRDSLKKLGSTYRAVKQPDLVISTDPWFRPVDIKLGPDGALWVADFYNRIIGHYEVPLTHPGRDRTHGRIWRIVYRGKKRAAPPPPSRDWTKADIDQLLAATNDSNLTVRLTATHELVRRGRSALVRGAITKKLGNRRLPSRQRVHLLWAAERIQPVHDARLIMEANHEDALVRVHVMRILANRSKLSTRLLEWARSHLNDSDPLVQRQAAQVLAEHLSYDNLKPLLALRAAVPKQDTHLLHAVRMAIRNQLRNPDIVNLVQAQSWSDREIRWLLDGILSLRSAAAAELAVRHLAKLEARRFDIIRHIVRYGNGATQEKLFHQLQRIYAGDNRGRIEALRAVYRGAQERGEPVGPRFSKWAREIVAATLDQPRANGTERIAALTLAAEAGLRSFSPRVEVIAGDPSSPPDVRVAALRCLGRLSPTHGEALARKVVTRAKESLPLRVAAIEFLAGRNTESSRATLVNVLAVAPADLQRTIALHLAASREGGDALVAAIGQGKASPRLLQDREIVDRLRRAAIPNLEPRLAKLTRGIPSADRRIRDLIEQRRRAFRNGRHDPRRGVAIFKKHCAACHQIDGQGGKIAPQLDGIGLRGPDRLFEDILDPSRNVDQQFRATTLALKNGQFVTGLLLRKEGNVLVLADTKGKEQRYPLAEVEARQVSQTSPMPADWADQISESDLYDLVAFLLNQTKQ